MACQMVSETSWCPMFTVFLPCTWAQVSAATHALLADSEQWEPTGGIPVKGKVGEPSGFRHGRTGFGALRSCGSGLGVIWVKGKVGGRPTDGPSWACKSLALGHGLWSARWD